MTDITKHPHFPRTASRIFAVALFVAIPIGIVANFTNSTTLAWVHLATAAFALATLAFAVLRVPDPRAPMPLLREITTPCCGVKMGSFRPTGSGERGWPIAFNEDNGVLQCHACGAIYIPEAEVTQDDIDLESAGSPAYRLWQEHGGGMDPALEEVVGARENTRPPRQDDSVIRRKA